MEADPERGTPPQTSGEKMWAMWSRVPAVNLLWGAISVGLVGFLVSYILWINRGCVSTPFISDLGMRNPEGIIFTLTIWAIIVPVAAAVTAKQVKLMAELQERKQTLAVWGPTVLAGCATVVGALIAGSTAWDKEYYLHFAAALVFFVGGIVFICGNLVMTKQLGYLEYSRLSGGSWTTLSCLLPLFIASCAGAPLYAIYRPYPPCPEDVHPQRDGVDCFRVSEREQFFLHFCYGEVSSHHFIGGNWCAMMEWLAFIAIAAGLVGIVTDIDSDGKTKETQPLLQTQTSQRPAASQRKAAPAAPAGPEAPPPAASMPEDEARPVEDEAMPDDGEAMPE